MGLFFFVLKNYPPVSPDIVLVLNSFSTQELWVLLFLLTFHKNIEHGNGAYSVLEPVIPWHS